MRQFVFNALLAENSLAQLDSQGIAVKGGKAMPPVISVEEFAFNAQIVYDAGKMASVFTAFFCLENSARGLIAERLSFRKGVDWWSLAVPGKIKTAVEKLKEKEAVNKYHTARSTASIGYTLFGNLAQIIIANWDDFSDIFPDQAWIMSRFNDLEMSRNVIMHTGTLPQIEVERIESILRDWSRQIG